MLIPIEIKDLKPGMIIVEDCYIDHYKVVNFPYSRKDGAITVDVTNDTGIRMSFSYLPSCPAYAPVLFLVGESNE